MLRFATRGRYTGKAKDQAGKDPEMAKKLFLHIGLHKTGTSAIQHVLYHAHDALKERGILYPKSVAWDDHSHHSLLFPFWRDDDFTPEFDKLQDEIRRAGCDTVIVSSELFPNAYQQRTFPALWQSVSALADDVEVIIYVRRQDRLAASVFKQWCKSDDLKLAMSPKDFIAETSRINMNFESYCAGWSKLPEVSKLHFRSYDHEKRDLIGSFLEILGLPRDFTGDHETVRANPTLDGEQLIFRHYFNGFDLPQDLSDALLSYLLNQLSPRPALDIFDTETRQALLQTYEKSNAAAFGTHAAEIGGFDDRMEESGHRFRAPTTPEVLDFFLKLSQFDKRLAAHLFDHIKKARAPSATL